MSSANVKFDYTFVYQFLLDRNVLLRSTDYKNNCTKLDVKCLVCNYEDWKPTFSKIRNSGATCPNCNGYFERYKKHTIEEARLLFKSSNITLLADTYISAHSGLSSSCDVCNHKWSPTYSSISQGKGCPECAKRNNGDKKRLKIDQVKELCLSQNILYRGGDYYNNQKPEPVECLICRYKWMATIGNISQGKGCDECQVNSTRLGIDACHALADERGGWCKSTQYVNLSTMMDWECHLNHEWSATTKSIRSGAWCIFCSKKISAEQTKIYWALCKKYPELEIILNALGELKPTKMELDIYIPSLKLGIEYNGERYHYSKWAIEVKSADKKMARKEQKCAEKRIKLINIREGEYVKNRDLGFRTLTTAIDEELSFTLNRGNGG
jgi:hypothetical protein